MALLSTEREQFVLAKGPKCRNAETRVLIKGPNCHNVETRILTKPRKCKSRSALHARTKKGARRLLEVQMVEMKGFEPSAPTLRT